MTGIIMALVAVLEIHMESMEVAVMNPAIRSPGEEPMARMAPRAMRWCRPDSSMLVAKIRAGERNTKIDQYETKTQIS